MLKWMENVKEVVLQQDVSIICHILSTPGKIKNSLAPYTAGGRDTHAHGHSCPPCQPHGALGRHCPQYAAELLDVVNIQAQSCTQPYLLKSFVHGNPKSQVPADTIHESD